MNNIRVLLVISMLIFASSLVAVSTLSAEMINKSGKIITTHYPVRFTGVGIINSIDSMRVIIDNDVFLFSSQIKFMTPRDEHSSVGAFGRGGNVGYVLNGENQITELCLILESKEGS